MDIADSKAGKSEGCPTFFCWPDLPTEKCLSVFEVERLVGQYAIIIDGEIVCRQTVEETVGAGWTLEDVYFQFAGRPVAEEMSWLG